MSSAQYSVRPLAKRNGLVFCLAGVGIIVLALLMRLTAIDLPWQVWAIVLAFSGFLLLLGVAKITEPEVSLLITPSDIRYLHRRGTWRVDWDNIVRFDVPRVHRGLDLEDLPYVGIRIENEDLFLAEVSPRLAVHLVNEQRHLLTMALRREQPELGDYSDYFDIPTRYVSRQGIEYNGIKAMFATRMQQLRQLLGYDIYISESALDRPLDEFCSHLRELREHRPAAQQDDRHDA